MPQHLTWQDEYTIGEPEIDAQHRQLILLANQILDMLPEADMDEVQAGLLSLAEYMEAHFCAEEALMERIGFPDQEAHGECHARILSEMQAMRENPATLPGIRDAVVILLGRWVEDHLHHLDSEIGAFLRKSS